MLRRHSVKSKSDLERRKSTASVNSVRLEHLDPIQAQRDAEIAAREAFARAQGRASVDMPLFPTPHPASPQRSPGCIGDEPRASTASRERTQGSRNHCRQQSVRYVGNAVCTTRSSQKLAPGRRPPSVDDSNQTLRQPIETLGQSEDCPLQNVPILEGQPSISLGEPLLKPLAVPAGGLAEEYISALIAEDEYYTPEDDIASAPSSYRRLRRSRSMFMSGDADWRSIEDETPITRRSVSRLPRSQTCAIAVQDGKGEKLAPPTSRLRAPKSMSFIKARHSRAPSVSSRAETAQGGNATVLGPRAGSKHSIFFGSHNRTSEASIGGMRKSLRRTSSNYGTSPVQTSHGIPAARDSIRNKARKTSRALRAKLATFFSLSRNGANPTALPEQHIEAKTSDVSNPFNSLISFDSEQNQARPSGVERGSLRRVPSSLPSIRSVPSTHFARCSRGSVESTGDDQERKVSDDKSLTSWAHSGPSTLNSEQQREWGEWERHRLSVIKENGGHAPSPSLRRPHDMILFQPTKDNTAEEAKAPRPVVDSQRVYSALMKRLRDAQQIAHAPESQHAPVPEYVNPLRAVESFEEKLSRTAQASPLTIRAVPLEDDVYTDVASTHKGKDAQTFLFHNLGSASSSRSTLTNSGSYKPCPEPTAGGSRGLSPRLLPGEVPSKGRPLSDRGSAFFGSPTSHLFRTASPYRRALHRHMANEVAPAQPRVPVTEFSSSDNGTLVRTSDTKNSLCSQHSSRESASDVGNAMPYSESIYSCQTEEHGQKRLISPPSLSGASISQDPPVTYRPTQGHRVESSVSSVDWKAWLAANVAKLDPATSPTRPAEIRFALPTLPTLVQPGHVREPAQTHPDDTDVGLFASPLAHKPPQALAPLSTVELNISKISPRASCMKQLTPTQLCDPILAKNRNFRLVPTPPVPARSPMRAVAASPSSHCCSACPRVHEQNSIASSPGLTAAVERQFGAVRKHLPATPTRAGKENGEDYGWPSSGVLGSGKEAAVRGSKRIVDLFLSSHQQGLTPKGGSSRAFL
ncbi:hypothetical protein GQ53DRAFT_694168 [Thozetella sp. PMI_491]|nr:hypothetical protein GQ53DRAFT_694168 [Thozetella sp. PMI_491]